VGLLEAINSRGWSPRSCAPCGGQWRLERDDFLFESVCRLARSTSECTDRAAPDQPDFIML